MQHQNKTDTNQHNIRSPTTTTIHNQNENKQSYIYRIDTFLNTKPIQHKYKIQIKYNTNTKPTHKSYTTPMQTQYNTHAQKIQKHTTSKQIQYNINANYTNIKHIQI